MGSHPKAPSTVPGGKTLGDFIREAPKAALGSSAVEFGNSLPFLFKILAVAQPLSIQCHPNRVQAKAGFAAENAAGLAFDAHNRNYRDDNHKPELIVALEEFWALKGFRAPEEIHSLAKAAKLASLRDLLPRLHEAEGLGNFFHALWTLGDHKKRTVLSELRAGLTGLPTSEARWTSELLQLYPDDIACIAPLLLRLVALQAGEGLYLGAGELHAYLQGTGLEIMANSDNVLRGGLTQKHMDVVELMRVLRFEHSPLELVKPSPMGQTDKANLSARATPELSAYATPSREFTLYNLALHESNDYLHLLPSASIFLSLSGQTQLRSGDECLELEEGGVAFATADTKSVRLRGNASLWIATIGTRSESYE